MFPWPHRFPMVSHAKTGPGTVLPYSTSFSCTSMDSASLVNGFASRISSVTPAIFVVPRNSQNTRAYRFVADLLDRSHSPTSRPPFYVFSLDEVE